MKIDFIQHDARKFLFDNEFELVIMLCEGGFSLMETDEMNFQILQNNTKELKKGGKLIFTTLNELFPIYNSINEFHSDLTKDCNSVATYYSEHFDLMTFRDYNRTIFTDDDGLTHEIECNERYYIPSEITWMLKSLNYKTIDIFGATLGSFSRNDTLSTKDFEMLIVAEKN